MIKSLKYNNDTLMGECPECGEGWKGESLVELYSRYERKAYPDEAPLSNEEIEEFVRKSHGGTTHQSVLIMNIDNRSAMCPFCNSSFTMVNDE